MPTMANESCPSREGWNLSFDCSDGASTSDSMRRQGCRVQWCACQQRDKSEGERSTSVHECRTQVRRRIAVNAYTSAHCTSLRTDTNSFGPCETERSPGPYAIDGIPSAA